MIFDENSLGKSVLGMIPAAVAYNASSTAIAIDTAGYESCVLSFAVVGKITSTQDLGECTAASGVPITLTGSDVAGSGYVALAETDIVTDDATYTTATSTWALDVDDTAVTGDIAKGYLIARVGIVSKYRYIKAVVSNPTGGGSKNLTHVSIVAELGRPRYSTDFLAYNVVPTQA